jgi:hypothetical protein
MPKRNAFRLHVRIRLVKEELTARRVVLEILIAVAAGYIMHCNGWIH